MIYFVSHHFNFGKNMKKKKKKKKNPFPKELFNEFWVLIEDYEYINIAEIKIVNFFFPYFYIFPIYHIFPHPLNGNLC